MYVQNAQEAVREFHRIMLGSEVAPQKPVGLDEYDGTLRCCLIEEEAREFRSAWESRDRTAMIDALCDLLYVTLGAGVQLGVDLEPFFGAVHTANLKKVGGTVRGDGKQLKPDGWTPPDIEGLYLRLYGGEPDGEPVQRTLPIDSVANAPTSASARLPTEQRTSR